MKPDLLKEKLHRLYELKDQNMKARIEISSRQKEVNEQNKELSNLRREIQDLKGIRNIEFSDHAMVRAFERLYDVDMDKVRDYILSPEVISLAAKMGGTGGFPHKDGFKVYMKSFTVTTVY